ncbi:hypothetical protein Tco_0514975 [Tanacetum coccineum]
MADKGKKSSMETFAPNDKADYYSGITSITVNGKNAYELKGKFLDDLHNNVFSGTNGKDAVEHIEHYLKIIDLVKLPNVDHDKLRIVVFSISLAGDLEWYEALEDSELKDEALRNKAIMEGLISDDESCNYGWRRWESQEITYHDQDEIEYENETHDERKELCEAHELPMCNIRKSEMIKYSFGQDEEYVAVKEDEYDDLARTSDDACQAYQEIFCGMDEGWMDLVKEISTNIGGEFTNLEILKCWSLETSRRLFNMTSCSINQHGESTEQISGEFLILILFNSLIMEYLVKVSKRRAFWSLNEDILKITILKTNTPYPSRKIRRIRACTHQRPQRKQAQYAVSREDQYAVLEI